jgi:hypothetical protein
MHRLPHWETTEAGASRLVMPSAYTGSVAAETLLKRWVSENIADEIVIERDDDDGGDGGRTAAAEEVAAATTRSRRRSGGRKPAAAGTSASYKIWSPREDPPEPGYEWTSRFDDEGEARDDDDDGDGGEEEEEEEEEEAPAPAPATDRAATATRSVAFVEGDVESPQTWLRRRRVQDSVARPAPSAFREYSAGKPSPFSRRNAGGGTGGASSSGWDDDDDDDDDDDGFLAGIPTANVPASVRKMSRRLQYAFEDVSGYDGWARIAAKIARASVVGVFGVLRIMFGLFTSPSKVSEHPVKATTAAIAVCSAFLLAMLTKAWYGVVKATYGPSGGRAGFVGGGGGAPSAGPDWVGMAEDWSRVEDAVGRLADAVSASVAE